MEKVVRILNQLPMTERSYTDRNGQNQVFASKGFVLTDGIDTFYAEMIGDSARTAPQYDMNQMHTVQTTLQMRSWKDQQGAEHYSTEVRINKLV